MARKYDRLVRLREARARGDAPPGAAALRALAEEFPGALRELDATPLDVLRARRDEALRGEPSPWLRRMHDYHRLMRATLWLKRVMRHAPDADAPSGDDALARAASDRAGVALDAGYVRAVRRPPHGRLSPLVFARLAAAHGDDAGALWQSLFPHPRAAAPWRERWPEGRGEG